MKRTLLTFLFLISAGSIFGEGYDSIHYYDEYRKGWALVEKDGLFGFIDEKGSEVVPVVYTRISYFGEYRKDLALVEKNGKKGFINRKGSEVVAP